MHRGALTSLFLLAAGPAYAIPVTVHWPEGLGTSYMIRGAQSTKAEKSGAYEIAEGERASLSGLGFNVSFNVHDGAVELPVDYQASNPGVQFDAKTNTFSFSTFPVHVDVTGYGDSIGIDSKQALSGVPVTLISGRHTLSYGSNRLPFDVQDDGYVLLDGDVAGITARHSGISIKGPVGSLTPAADTAQIGDQQQHDAVLASSEKAAWKQDFVLEEKMDLWDFAEQQVCYAISLPADFKPGDLKLLAFTDSSVRVIPFQLTDGGAAICFRTDLPRRARRLFRLVTSFDTKGIADSTAKPPVMETTPDSHVALLQNGLLFLQVPAGHRDFPGGKPLAEVLAPIVAAGRDAKNTMARESFVAPGTLKVDAMEGKLIESGPVFATYQVTYHLEGGKTYTTLLELRAGESHVTTTESLAGFSPDDHAFLRLDYGKGLLDPDRRLVAGIGAGTDHGYDRYSGAYDRHISTDDHFRPWMLSSRWLDYDPKLDDSKVPRLDFRLGLFIPNTLGVVHAATFFRDNGDDALLLAINRPEDWKESTRAVWTDYRAIENLRFYREGDAKYMTCGLAGEKRSWALGLIPRHDAVLRAMDKVPAGPEVWLSTQLGMWNLQAQKDRQVDWDEKLDTAPPPNAAMANEIPPKTPAPMSYAEYAAHYLDKYVVRDMANFGPFFGYLNGRSFPVYYDAYVRSRATWTPEQRERVRQILVFLTDYNDGDDYQPSHSMLGGHPNFENDAKQNVAIGLATFPNHPKAKVWRDSFLRYCDEFLDTYTRKDVPELNTRGGRWTENIACYWGQSLTGLLNAELALQSCDGTTLARNPHLHDLIRWMRDAMMSPDDGQRFVPPEGAHATSFMPVSAFWKGLFQLSAALAPGDPQLAQDMHWIETGGQQGVKPDVRSVLYTDYGAIFHYDFGGAHESYAHLQDINGMSYRWGYPGPLPQAGIVYYGAKNKIWSYNSRESDGDEFDWTKVTALTVNGQGLTAGPTDQLLEDFDFAQFYRQPGRDGDDYLARALMLLRDDYLVVADELKSPTTSSTFRWVNFQKLPEIYQLKPGAKMEDSTFPESAHLAPGAPLPNFYRRTYSGRGDFLTVVAPSPVDATATTYGASVNGEYVFASQKPEEIMSGHAVFAGNYGYARARQLALFQGTRIGLDGFMLQRNGGDFAASAAAEPSRISGRIVGRAGGKISIIPPTGYDVTKAAVTFDGKLVSHTVENGAVSFSVEIAQRDGIKTYAITF